MSLYKRIVDFGKPIKRILFHEITKKAIEKALKEPKEIFDEILLINSQFSRRAVDRIVGFLGSTCLSNAFSKQLSAGRVQSILVSMVYDLEEKIENFIPEEYFTITASLTDGKIDFVTKYPNKLTD